MCECESVVVAGNRKPNAKMSWLEAVAMPHSRCPKQLHMPEALIIVPELKRFSKQSQGQICYVFTANSSTVSSVCVRVFFFLPHL